MEAKRYKEIKKDLAFVGHHRAPFRNWYCQTIDNSDFKLECTKSLP